MLILSCLIAATIFKNAHGHGRLLNPPARTSAWRFDALKFPTEFNDNQMFCGGFQTQWNKNSIL